MSDSEGMADGVVAELLKNPIKYDELEKMKRDNLLRIAKYLQLEIPSACKKSDLIRLIAPHVVGKSDESESENDSDKESGFKLKTELMKLNLEQEKLIFRENEAQREAQRLENEAQCEAQRIENEAQRQHELRKLELQGKPVESRSIDITKYIRLVPKYNEEEVAKYFTMFEKVANSLKWENKYGQYYCKVHL